MDRSRSFDAPPIAGARASAYRIEWRHRWRSYDGGKREVTRARDAADALALKDLGRRFVDEAVGREYMIRLLDAGRAATSVCVRAEELEAWTPVEGALPRGLIPTRWLEDEEAGAHRYRLFAIVTDAFAEARALRLVGRKESREVVLSIRGMLLGS